MYNLGIYVNAWYIRQVFEIGDFIHAFSGVCFLFLFAFFFFFKISLKWGQSSYGPKKVSKENIFHGFYFTESEGRKL